MADNFIRVYRSTPDHRRVLFVWRFNPRLKIEPLSLAAFCSFNPATNESQSYLFTESFNLDLNRELSSFMNHVCSYSEFSKIAKASQDRFCALLKSVTFPECDFNETPRLW